MELTGGSRWGLFGIIVFFGVIGWAVDQMMQRMFMPHETMDELKVYVWASLGSGLVLGAIQAVTAAVAYHDLRLSKEGVGIEELAAVFD
jgi:hypothetical protein